MVVAVPFLLAADQRPRLNILECELSGRRLQRRVAADGNGVCILVRGFAALGLPLTREQFALRTDDQVAYGRLVAAGAGIGFVAAYNIAHWPGVQPLLPMLKIPPLPCWLAVHREIRGSRVVRRVYDFLAEAIPRALAR